MAPKQKSIIERLTAEAVRLAVNELEVEYKDGYEEVVALVGSIGFGIARFRSSSREARSLREELYGIRKKKRRVVIGDSEYDVRAQVYESFGEDAFRLQLRRV
ncbi:MAG: hypothetical protein ACREQ7_21235 [Candidatus Binatia bacterium]